MYTYVCDVYVHQDLATRDTRACTAREYARRSTDQPTYRTGTTATLQLLLPLLLKL